MNAERRELRNWLLSLCWMNGWVMAAAAAMAPPNEANAKRESNISLWVESTEWRKQAMKNKQFIDWFELVRQEWSWWSGRAPRQRGSGACNYERRRKAQQAKRNKFLFVGRCSWRSLIDCGAVLPPSINSLRFRHTAGQPIQFLNQFSWRWKRIDGNWLVTAPCLRKLHSILKIQL